MPQIELFAIENPCVGIGTMNTKGIVSAVSPCLLIAKNAWLNIEQAAR